MRARRPHDWMVKLGVGGRTFSQRGAVCTSRKEFLPWGKGTASAGAIIAARRTDPALSGQVADLVV